MLYTLDIKSILGALIISGTIISVLLYYAVTHMLDPTWPAHGIARITSSIVSPLLVALLASNVVWRKAWQVMSKLNISVYPDLNGIWEGTIQPSDENGHHSVAPIPIKARIAQSMFNIFIDFQGDTFSSITLAAVPCIEKNQHHLHYIYQSKSHDPTRPPYEGTTTLRVQFTNDAKAPSAQALTLSGQYYTVRNTQGTIRLTQLTTDASKDILYRKH